MKKYIYTIMLAASLLLPLSMSAEPRGNNNRSTQSERTSNSHRHSGNNGRPGNNGNNQGRPGNNGVGNHHGNNNSGHNNRPGNNKNDKRGHDKNQGNHGHNKHDHDKWGGNSHNRPGGPGHGSHKPPVKPGHHSGPAWRPGSSAAAPGFGRPHHHHPKLGYMVNHAIRGGRYDNVWMVAPGQYAVRYFRNGYYYMQYIWPETGRYGSPFRIVMSGPGQWYAYGNPNQWYYDDGATLRISLNGSPMDPWTLIPAIELNINL